MWTIEIENMWKSRFKVIADPDQLFHDCIEMCSKYEALDGLKLAIAEIERLRSEVKRLEDEIEWGGR